MVVYLFDEKINAQEVWLRKKNLLKQWMCNVYVDIKSHGFVSKFYISWKLKKNMIMKTVPKKHVENKTTSKSHGKRRDK